MLRFFQLPQERRHGLGYQALLLDRVAYIVEKKPVFKKEFVINSEGLGQGKRSEVKQAQFEFGHDGKRHTVDCGVIDQPDHVQNFVCGFNTWNERAKGWDTTARAVTEVGAPLLAVLQGDDRIDFDINCQLRRTAKPGSTR